MIHALPRLQTIALGLLLCLAAGCGKTLNTRYALARGDSINGLSAFIQTLRSSGHKVETLPFATERLGETHECIIFFDDESGPIDQKKYDFLKRLGHGSAVLTIVWVAKNGTVTPEYWSKLLEGNRLTAKQKDQAAKEKSASADERDKELSDTFSLSKGLLYGLENPKRKAQEGLTEIRIAGSDNPPIKCLWPLQRKMINPPDALVLWSSQGEPLLVEETLSGTKLLILSSAIPLLNAGLADPGNRALCAQLIDEISAKGRVAVIPTSRFVDGSEDDEQGMFHFLKVQPYPWIALQLVLALVLFCWWRFPILGRPRQGSNRELQRFGRHVEAFGDLLRRARGRSFAWERIREWQRVRKPHGKNSESKN